MSERDEVIWVVEPDGSLKRWRWWDYPDESQDDDEELEQTPPHVVAALGFDPKELDDDPDEEEGK